jgi:hypothetical protein
MKTLLIVAAVAGLMLAAPDAHAVRKRLSVHKKERLHERCDARACASKGAAPTLSFQTSGVYTNAASFPATAKTAFPGVDRWGSFFWLFSLVVTGAFMLKEPFARTSPAPPVHSDAQRA